MTPDQTADILASEDLPPLQYMVLEVLAARYRLGEHMWTFPTRLRPALRAMESRHLVWWKYGNLPHTCVAKLTDKGRELALSASYVSPAAAQPAPGGAFIVSAFRDLAGRIAESDPARSRALLAILDGTGGERS